MVLNVHGFTSARAYFTRPGLPRARTNFLAAFGDLGDTLALRHVGIFQSLVSVLNGRLGLKLFISPKNVPRVGSRASTSDGKSAQGCKQVL